MIIAILAGCSDGTAGMEVTNSSPPEAKLAAIDLGTRRVPPDTIATYASVLDRLQGKCTEPRDRIGDFAVVGVDQLKEEKGMEVTIYRFLRMMDDSVPSSTDKLKCIEIAAALVTLTERP
jgi:hypothetical protein